MMVILNNLVMVDRHVKQNSQSLDRARSGGIRPELRMIFGDAGPIVAASYFVAPILCVARELQCS